MRNTTLLWVYTIAVDASADEQQRIRGNSKKKLNDNVVILTHQKTVIQKETFNSIDTSASHRSI